VKQVLPTCNTAPRKVQRANEKKKFKSIFVEIFLSEIKRFMNIGILTFLLAFFEIQMCFKTLPGVCLSVYLLNAIA